jgi:hypothetical protein
MHDGNVCRKFALTHNNIRAITTGCHGTELALFGFDCGAWRNI